MTQRYLKIAIPSKQLLCSPKKGHACIFDRRSQHLCEDIWAFPEDVAEPSENISSYVRQLLWAQIFSSSPLQVDLETQSSSTIWIFAYHNETISRGDTLWQFPSNICYNYSNSCSCSAITFRKFNMIFASSHANLERAGKSISNQCEPLMRASKQKS